MRFLKRLKARTIVTFDGEHTFCRKGNLRAAQFREIGAVLKRAGAKSGEIWIAKDGRVSFSDDIPKRAHQPVRNCL